MTQLQVAIREKRDLGYQRYGGMMSLVELAHELKKDEVNAREWARERGIGTRDGRRIKYETDMVMKAIVLERGMV